MDRNDKREKGYKKEKKRKNFISEHEHDERGAIPKEKVKHPKNEIEEDLGDGFEDEIELENFDEEEFE